MLRPVRHIHCPYPWDQSRPLIFTQSVRYYMLEMSLASGVIVKVRLCAVTTAPATTAFGDRCLGAMAKIPVQQ